MVMQAEPIYQAYQQAVEGKDASKIPVILMSPAGRRFDQSMARELARHEEIILLFGQYEGIDSRVTQEIVTDKICIGDYVLTGGELAALVVMLGLAVFVNWYYSGTDTKLSPEGTAEHASETADAADGAARFTSGEESEADYFAAMKLNRSASLGEAL